MSVEKKLSPSAVHLLNKIKPHHAKLAGEDGKVPHDARIKLDRDQTIELLDGYTTKVSDGTERGVSIGDLEAAGNFRRDMQNAGRVLTGDFGHDTMLADPECSDVRLSVEIEPLGTTIESAFYRPKQGEQASTNFVSITDEWDGNDDDKAIEAHLKKLTQKLSGYKK